ncbi:hypothetical protein [Paraburkholderia sp. J41]|uniref:hypothetical protein n=1 Tax=Paraburkholderia sp. J41 TaxID=2805433 RepID=UPI002AC33032|nr:hypothetical protein [Paraburkholderia sp. J41]
MRDIGDARQASEFRNRIDFCPVIFNVFFADFGCFDLVSTNKPRSILLPEASARARTRPAA